MQDYFRWSLRQLYLAFFWPSLFVREAAGNAPSQPRLGFGRRVIYILNTLPWSSVLAVVGNLFVGYMCQLFGVVYQWEGSWVGVWIGVWIGALFDVVFGALFGAVAGLGGGVAFGAACMVTCLAAFGIAGGAVAGVGSAAAWGHAFETTFDIAFGAALGAALGASVGVSIGLGANTLYGVALGVVLCVVVGFAFGYLVFGAAVGVAFFRLFMYPLDVTISTAAYFVGRWRPRMAVRVWRYCPVTWNELIWLPLPYASKLLVMLVKQNREEGFRQIAFVAAERPLQRRVALAALAEVAIDDLKAGSISELPDVTERLGWTTDAPGGDLPEGLAMTLPRLDRVARHVGQYLTLNSPYRKREALESAITEVEALRRSLIAARGDFASRLLQLTNEWQELLKAEHEQVEAQAEGAREIPNPFVYGSPVTETSKNVFAGRQDIVRQIEASLLGTMQTPTLLLHGPRRMGKTSILNQLPRLLGPDFAPAIVDCHNPAVVGSEATMLRYLARALSEGLRRRRVHVEPLAASALAQEPFAAFDDWLDSVERAMPEDLRALLCLDEYERLQATLASGWGESFLDALRHTIQFRPRLVLMFTGAHTFQELGPIWTDRFISARRVRVSFLGREDVELLLTKPIPEFDMTYAPGTIDAVVAATNCQPFLTQAVAFELVQLLNERRRREANLDDVEEAVTRALVSGGEYFANVWSDAGEQGQAILRALARGETPPAFHAASTLLKEHDVLDSEGDFAVEMLRRWVKMRFA